MKQEESPILKKLGKEPGFNVPEHYFADFSKNLMDSLPEVEITEEVKPSRWVRLRPYVYMAAMFAGIWCTMKVFTGFGGDQKKAVKTEMTADSPNSGAKAIMQDDKRINDNAMLNYQDSINAGIQKTNINR
jgi:hypothetical protein